LVVFIVYILSRIVDKFFLRSTTLAVNEHPDFALLRPDHHRLAAHTTHHVEGIHRAAPQGQLEGVIGNPLLDGLSQLVGDLEEPVGRTKPPDPLVRPLVVVILHPQRGALHRLLEAVELCALQKLPQDRLPEALDLAERHGVMRPGADVPHPVLFQLLLEARLAPPVRVLPAVVGQNLFGDPVLGDPATIGLQDVLGRLAAVQSKCCDVAAVVVDEADQVGVVTPQSDSQDVALPELVGAGALEEARLGWVLLRLDGALLHQAPRRECFVNRRRAGAHQKKTLENIGDPPRSVLRVLGLHRHRLSPDLLRHSADPAGRHPGCQPRLPVKPVGPYPALDRVRADPKLLHQQPGAVAFFQKQLYDPQPELHREGQGSDLLLPPACGTLGPVRHRVTSSPCKRFFTLGSVTPFS
jgi:hypothetical protein